MVLKVIFSEKCLEYSFPYHPESPDRVKRIKQALEKDFTFEEIEEFASREEILRAHSREHFERVKNKEYSDFDNPPLEIEYPLLAAKLSILAAKEQGFALVRPPGHHAGKDFLGGFCYFNNIAIAIRNVYENRRVVIFDLDVHHGNGTQDIFLGDKNILYISLHQSPLFPGTGLKSEMNCINFPLPPGTNEYLYLKTLEKAVNIAMEFGLEVVAISLGFDTYCEDPLANFELKKGSYEKIAKIISNFISSQKAKFFFVLEGGYSKEIGKLALEFFEEFVKRT